MCLLKGRDKKKVREKNKVVEKNEPPYSRNEVSERA
jgi:hypothetical protein